MNVENIIENLTKRGFKPYFAQNCEEANLFIENLFNDKATIGFGGSVTVLEMKLLEALKKSSKQLSLYLRDLMKEDGIDIDTQFKLMHDAEWYISSTNALTQSGELINIDGRGNRVAKMLYGTKNYIVVTGINKIVETIDEGINRVRNVASPKNTRKLNKKTPCAATGKCGYCCLPDTICRATVIQHMPTSGLDNYYVIIINQSLGF